MYKNVLHELKIRKRNVINFDETEFRIDCTREEQIIMFEEIKQIYAINSENRISHDR